MEAGISLGGGGSGHRSKNAAEKVAKTAANGKNAIKKRLPTATKNKVDWGNREATEAGSGLKSALRDLLAENMSKVRARETHVGGNTALNANSMRQQQLGGGGGEMAAAAATEWLAGSRLC